MNKKKIRERLPEPQPNKEKMPIIKHRSVGPTIVNDNFKPHLNLEDAKLDLGFKAQTLDLKSWILFILECSQNVKGFYEWFDETYKRKDFSIFVKVGTGFYIDSSQMRELYYDIKQIGE